MGQMGHVVLDGNEWNVIEVVLGGLHTGARFAQDIDYHRTVTGTVYEVTSAATDNEYGWVFVHNIDEGDNPLAVSDDCSLASEDCFINVDATALHFVDPEFYSEPIVHGAQLALALQALDNGIDIHPDGLVFQWNEDIEQAVEIPDYGRRALAYAYEHGLAVNVYPGSADAGLTTAGEALLETFQVGYWHSLRAGWTDVPTP
jgi:hypothetical protein